MSPRVTRSAARKTGKEGRPDSGEELRSDRLAKTPTRNSRAKRDQPRLLFTENSSAIDAVAETRKSVASSSVNKKTTTARPSDLKTVPKEGQDAVNVDVEHRNQKTSSSSSISSPTVAIDEAIATIESLVESFVDAATRVQASITSAITTVSTKGLFSTVERDQQGLERICRRVMEINNEEKSSQYLVKAHEHWRQMMSEHSSLIRKLLPKERIRLGTTGRGLAASLMMTGNTYGGLTILKEVLEIVEQDPNTAMVLVRWLVRSSEWGALDRLLEADRNRKRSHFEGFHEVISVYRAIREFHRTPGEKTAVKLLEIRHQLIQQKPVTAQNYEAQVLLHNTLALVSKVAGVQPDNMMDPLYCINYACEKAETLAKSRWATFGRDVPLGEMRKKDDKHNIDFLKSASSVAEHFDQLRLTVNEYVRCAILREPVTLVSTGLSSAIRLGFPAWITQTLSLLLFARQRSVANVAEAEAVRSCIRSVFTIESDRETTNDKDESIHTPCNSSGCGCYLCLESSFNPEFAFSCAALSFLYSGNSVESMSRIVAAYNVIRSAFAPAQLALMNITTNEKPRPPSMVCDEMGKLLISFLLAPVGLAMERSDPKRRELEELVNKICTYFPYLCRPYRLIAKQLSRRQGDEKSFSWMVKEKSITAALGDLSISPKLQPTVDNKSTDKEDEEERREFKTYAHLLYHDWRGRICEQLSLKSSDPWIKAFYLSETMAVGTRQARRLIDGKITPFGFRSVDEFKGAVRKMPSDMTVIQLIVTTSGQLCLVRVHALSAPIVVPLANEEKWSHFLSSISRVVSASEESARVKDKREYWNGRRKAEEMMKEAMIDLENDLLGAFAPLLLPAKRLTKQGESIAASLTRSGEGGMSKELGKEMVAIAAQTTYEKFMGLIECMALLERWSPEQVKDLLKLKKYFDNSSNVKWIEPITALPFVFFVLSTELSPALWEAVKCLEDRAHCSRLISIHQLFSSLNTYSKVPHSKNPASAFFILDPANNLPKTTDRLAPVVQKVPSWKGVTGKPPTVDQVRSMTAEHDFFIYLGHDNGHKYLSRTLLRKSQCRAVALLMGCSSAHTVHEGRGMDGQGAVIDYSVASCPCLVGCLYAVSDGEIDRYFTALVDEGLARHLRTEEDPTPSSELRHLLEAMAIARSRVKLPYLTGAAVVAYGIPIDIAAEEKY